MRAGKNGEDWFGESVFHRRCLAFGDSLFRRFSASSGQKRSDGAKSKSSHIRKQRSTKDELTMRTRESLAEGRIREKRWYVMPCRSVH